jgi:transcriptional/translational regulatory protein YebC/TACO1
MIVEVETDNKNRILGEIKLIFRNYGGSLGDNNSVMFQFSRVGEIELKNDISEEKQLELIDLGVNDFDDKTLLVNPDNLIQITNEIKKMNLEIVNSSVSLRANNPTLLESEDEVEKIIEMIEEIEENDDVLNVFAGFDYKKV